MTVIGKKVGRLDIRLVRGDTQRVGGRWRKHNLVTGVTSPVDLTSWAGVFELRSPDGGEQWYAQSCQTMSTDGYAIADIPSAALTGDEWLTRRTGQWKISVTNTNTGTRKTIAWGYWTMSN